jgi:hypothetical protein
MTSQGPRTMLVRRGNMEVVYALDHGVFTGVPVNFLASRFAEAFIQQQRSAPSRASQPIRLDETPLALRVIGRDSPLEPSLPLSMQTEGLWEIRELPVQAQSDATARLPVCAFELIDVERPSVIVAHAGV